MIIFETERLIVRALSPEDGDNYFSIHGDEEVMRFIRPAKNKEECNTLLKTHIDYNQTIYPFGRWMVEDKTDHNFLGTFVIFPINDTKLMQIGYSLLKQYWGRGYASELTKAGIEYFFAHSNDDALFAIVEKGNYASEKLLRKLGFIVDQYMKEDNKSLTRFIRTREED